MGEINIPRSQQDSLNAVDTSALDKAIDECIADESGAALQRFRLANCGPYVANHLRLFERAMSARCEARSAKKRADTGDYLRSAGEDLAHAVSEMRLRLEKEGQEGQRFYVEDEIMWPSYYSERLTAQVNYRWRRSVTDKWEVGSITFTHKACSQPEYMMGLTKRKPREQDRQDKLRAEG